MRLAGITDLSTVDWWGKLTTTIFFAKCNYRCRFCYNHELIYPNSGYNASLNIVYDYIKDNLPLIDAVVCTGGEPCLQPLDLYDIAEFVRMNGREIMVDTNGSHPEVIEGLIERNLIDRMALDIKAPLAPIPYSDMCGVDRFEYIKVRDTLKKSRRVDTEVRTTVVPDTYSDLENTEYIIGMIKNYPVEYHIQQFDSSNPLDKTLVGTDTYSFDELYQLGIKAKRAGIKKVLVKSKEHTEYVTED